MSHGSAFIKNVPLMDSLIYSQIATGDEKNG